jgi:hypothetical protein
MICCFDGFTFLSYTINESPSITLALQPYMSEAVSMGTRKGGKPLRIPREGIHIIIRDPDEGIENRDLPPLCGGKKIELV